MTATVLARSVDVASKLVDSRAHHPVTSCALSIVAILLAILAVFFI